VPCRQPDCQPCLLLVVLSLSFCKEPEIFSTSKSGALSASFCNWPEIFSTSKSEIYPLQYCPRARLDPVALLGSSNQCFAFLLSCPALISCAESVHLADPTAALLDWQTLKVEQLRLGILLPLLTQHLLPSAFKLVGDSIDLFSRKVCATAKSTNVRQCF